MGSANAAITLVSSPTPTTTPSQAAVRSRRSPMSTRTHRYVATAPVRVTSASLVTLPRMCPACGTNSVNDAATSAAGRDPASRRAAAAVSSGKGTRSMTSNSRSISSWRSQRASTVPVRCSTPAASA